MLQRLLADRFGLRVHHEQRRLTIYELTQSSPSALGSTIGVDEQAALLTALREQLGLKLDTTRAPYDVVVVDAVSTLTPN